MLQKLKTRVSCKLTYALLLCAITTSKTYSQERETISITPDDMSYLTSAYRDDITIFKVEQKKISTYANPIEIAKLEKLDERYESWKKSIDNSLIYRRLKDPIAEYYQLNEVAAKRNEAISIILSKIETYQASKEKYKNKKHHLYDAQMLANEYKINIVISELVKAPKSMYTNRVERALLLYDNDKRIQEKDIEKYKSELQTRKIFELEKPKELVVKEQLKEYKSDSIERVTYVTNPEPMDALAFVGNFKVLYEKYRMCNANVYEFVQYELLDEKSKNCRDQQKYPVFQNESTNELYYVAVNDFVGKLNRHREFENLKKDFTKYGYVVNANGQVKTKMATVNFGEWLIKKLEANPNYLKQLDADYSKIAELYKALPAHSKTLDRFIGLYRIQRRMSTSNIDSWRTATQKANLVFKQIYKLNEKYEDRVWDISSSIDKSDIYEDFMDNLIVSKHILGM